MLTDAFRAMVNNQFRESLYGKRKEKQFNILTTFFIFHKSGVKIFLKWIVNHYPFFFFNFLNTR